jgi:hypothetical protein
MSEDPATTPADPAAPAVPADDGGGEERLVRHRKRRRHSFRPESDALARRREDLRALSWILPVCMLALGAIILFVEMRNPEPAARAKDVVAIGCALLGIGAAWLSAGLAWRWFDVVRRWRAENGEEPRRHRRHHHHHHGSTT